ncbi:hypothetical protein BG015_008853 [Linnemannia schmuckeri]|uniref:Protein transport protein SFT2 n=1 Tax=Linnemannia schmuckeri TaxID=64567 RepID=A0A9P5S8B1_9FUNG|nr:hypothetical protein BG015_008853 [Linnemannia schmuckeri]
MAIWGMSSVANNDDVMDDSNPLSCFTLNRTQRLYGFGIWNNSCNNSGVRHFNKTLRRRKDEHGMEEMTNCQGTRGTNLDFVVGFLISILSTLSLATGQLALFAVFFTLGNIISMLSTTFLIGPGKQLKTMFAPVRMVASIVFLAMIVVTLIVAFTIQSSVLCLVLCIIQFLALFWYSASYIPYGRAAIKKVVGGCIEV